MIMRKFIVNKSEYYEPRDMHPENERPDRSRPLVTLKTVQDPLTGERSMRSEVLLEGRRALVIIHGQERYRLQCTRTGKLILTK